MEAYSHIHASPTKNKIRLAKINFKNNEHIDQNAKAILQHSIERDYVNVTATLKKYILLPGKKMWEKSRGML